MARQTRPEVSSAAEILALQCAAGGRHRHRGDRSWIPLLRRAFLAVWEDELNLADPDEVAKLANAAGLPGQQLVERSGSEAISAAYEQNRQDALAADVFGSPVYVLDGEVFWGQDRIELLADALKSGRKPYSSRL